MSAAVQRALAAGWICLLGMGILAVAVQFSQGMWVMLTLPLMLTGSVLMGKIFNHACSVV